MAVFPDRIVLKNSTDSQAVIEAAIGAGGTDQITQGEVVVGLENNAATFYTIDGSGNVVRIGSAIGTIERIGDLLDVDLSTAALDGQVLAYNSNTGNWEPVSGNTASATVEGWTIDSDGSSGLSQALNAPTHSQGDLLVACISVDTSASVTAPTGWVEHSSHDLFGGRTIRVYTKWATASEPISYAWTLDVSASICGYIAAIGGTTGIELITSTSSNGGSTSGSTVANKLNLICSTWRYSSASESYSTTGDAPELQITEITDSPNLNAHISGGYTTLGGSFTASHSNTSTANNPNQLLLVIQLASKANTLDALNDVNTSENPPTNGQALVWNTTNSRWEPGAGGGGGGGLAYWGGGDFDTGTSDGEPADGGNFD